MQVKPQPSSRLGHSTSSREFKLDPLIMLVLVPQELHADLPLSEKAAAVHISHLDEQVLSASGYIERDDFLPHGLYTILHLNGLSLCTLAFDHHVDYNVGSIGGFDPASLNNSCCKDGVKHDAVLVHLLSRLDLLKASHKLLTFLRVFLNEAYQLRDPLLNLHLLDEIRFDEFLEGDLPALISINLSEDQLCKLEVYSCLVFTITFQRGRLYI